LQGSGIASLDMIQYARFGRSLFIVQ